MRLSPFILALTIPTGLVADGGNTPPQVDVTHLLEEASGHDWNGDGHPDRLVMVISESRDALDIITFMSDAETGKLGFVRTDHAVLPANWPVAENDLYTVFYGSIGYDADYSRPGLSASVTESFIHTLISWHDDHWELFKVTTEHRQLNQTCRLDYSEGKGVVDPHEGEDIEIPLGEAPQFTSYWWRDGLPEKCRV